MSSSTVHPVLTLINRCDALAAQFDTTFSHSCKLLTNLSNGQSSATLDETLMVLRKTLDECEQVVGAMLGCIYEDIPHLLDMIDSQAEGGGGEEEKGRHGIVGNWNPKQALDGISQLFYVSCSYKNTLSRRERSADIDSRLTVIPRPPNHKTRVASRLYVRRNLPRRIHNPMDIHRLNPRKPAQTTGRRLGRSTSRLLDTASPQRSPSRRPRCGLCVAGFGTGSTCKQITSKTGISSRRGKTARHGSHSAQCSKKHKLFPSRL